MPGSRNPCRQQLPRFQIKLRDYRGDISMTNRNPALINMVLLACFSALLNGCGVDFDGQSRLNYGLTLSPSGIDPHLNASAELGIPLRSVYDTLVYLDPETGAFVPGLAESWTVSDNGLEYTFDLRQDIQFHDGTRFDAQAVKINLEYVLNPDHHSQKAAALLGPIDSVDVIDQDTVRIVMNEPFAPLLDALSQVYLGMASPQALEQWGPAEYQFHQVGTGPYRFVEYVPDDHILLERFAEYNWAPAIYANDSGAYQMIEFRFFEDIAARSIALESGNVDILGEIPPSEASRLSILERFSLHPIAIPGQPLQYLFNTHVEPTDDIRVRTALILAVDRARIVETVFGPMSPVAQGPLSAERFGSLLSAELPAYDPSEAIRLLGEAGWIMDQEGLLRSADGATFILTLVAPVWGSNPDVAQLIKVAWEDIGAEVDLQIAPGFGPLREMQAAGEYNVIGINFFGTDPDLLRPMYSSGGLYNWSGYANEALDLSLQKAAQATGEGELRTLLYQQSIEHIVSQSLVLPIRDYVNLVISRNDVTGLNYSAPGWFPFLIDLEPAS